MHRRLRQSEAGYKLTKAQSKQLRNIESNLVRFITKGAHLQRPQAAELLEDVANDVLDFSELVGGGKRGGF